MRRAPAARRMHLAEAHAARAEQPVDRLPPQWGLMPPSEADDAESAGRPADAASAGPFRRPRCPETVAQTGVSRLSQAVALCWM
jgi:hypothetical protein